MVKSNPRASFASKLTLMMILDKEGTLSEIPNDLEDCKSGIAIKSFISSYCLREV